MSERERERLTHVCPVCNGEQGGDQHCWCGGLGAITETMAASWTADGEPEPKRLAPQPKRMERPCRECAFRRGSPEREDFGAAVHLAEKVAEGEPFFCHTAMPVDHRGKYVSPQGTRNGVPIGAPVCAGYADARKRYIGGERLAFLRPRGRRYQEPTP